MAELPTKRRRLDADSTLSQDPAGRLRALLRRDGCHVVPGCYDCITAKAIEEAGFDVCFMSGYAVSASRLGMPDVGLCTYSEMLESATNICRCIGDQVCVIGDGDTGYGGLSNLRRTVEGYARSGLAGISIEDQVFPKRCAYAKGVEVVPREEAETRLRAALLARDELRARTGLDLVVVGRTDARRAVTPEGGAEGDAAALEEALCRCEAFERLGADIVYAEGLRSREEMRALHARLRGGTPTMLAQVECGADGKVLSAAEAGDLGFKLCLFGVTMLNAALCAARRVARQIASGDSHPEVGRELLPFKELYASVGFDEVYAWEARAREPAPSRGGKNDGPSAQDRVGHCL
mmetsp:Transcript_90101/g.289018  ORF Transcript_90101/g.289018 Transcript_90101/m.289018 type:complete len:350 (-) Transcript_90101:25-1074(-)